MNFFNQKLSINGWMIVIAGLLVITIGLGAYFLGSQRINSSTQPLGENSNPTTDPMETLIAQTLPTNPSTSTPTQDIFVSQTAAAALTETATPAELVTGTPTISTTPTLIAFPEDWAILVSESPADSSYIAPIYPFTKIWTVKNIGTTTWTKDYHLVYFGGTSMTKKLVSSLPVAVPPGKTIQLNLEQTAPKTPGTYQGFWMLSNSSGDTFGIGERADQPFKNKITVLNVDPTNNYDFLLEYCQADWWNHRQEVIKCPGVPSKNTGFVLLSAQPSLENGPSDKPVLWVHTNNAVEGIISGIYPPYQVTNGDQF